jgi:hypothetical protein
VRKAVVLAGLAGVLTLTGCGGSGDAADPPGGAGAGSDPATDQAGPADPVLGPAGFGAIKLGSSEADGVAAGLSWANVAGYTDRACPKVATIPRSGFPTVHLSSRLGIAVIGAAGDMHTPEGIRVGSTRAAVRKAYPALKNETGDPNDRGINVTAVAGNPAASYRITIDNTGTVGSLDLMLNANRCLLV